MEELAIRSEAERKRFAEYPHKYVSIGITPAGERCNSVAVPWESSANAFNMKLPDLYLAPEDLQGGVLQQLQAEKIIDGCYIFTPLEDYSFLEELTQLKDLSIYYGDGLRDVSFLQKMTECRLIFLHRAQLERLLPPELKIGLPSLYLSDCRVENLTPLMGEEPLFHELIIANPKARDERARWHEVKALTKRYYDLK